MIISHRHRFIFLKTIKTAGTSIEIALSKHCGPKDTITAFLTSEDEEIRRNLGYRGPQNFVLPERDGARRRMLSPHTLASNARQRLPSACAPRSN